jgi:hypothetical protein
VNTLNKIIAIFENDDGGKWTQAERDHALARWLELSLEDRAYLDGLSEEDLDNACTGETRYDENDQVTRVLGGQWTTLPPAVDQFLETVWSFNDRVR